MKKALIVSPHFPPINAPDHQRVRMMLPHFEECGWEVEVLAVDPEWVSAPQDNSLLETVPKGIPVHRVRGIPPSWTRPLGFDNLAWRTVRALSKRGAALLASGSFDLIFFSTTQYGVLSLALPWKKKYRLPYVIDIQDPLVNDYYQRTGTPPPGGRLKYAFARMRAKRMEQEVLAGAGANIVVSHDYTVEICQRNSCSSRRNLQPWSFPARDGISTWQRGIIRIRK
jgi:glycosyltransferase involved in cell wall biosynthesis